MGGVFWAIVGVISLYLIVGRIGAKISSAIGHQLDRVFASTEEIESVSAVRLARPPSVTIMMRHMYPII